MIEFILENFLKKKLIKKNLLLKQNGDILFEIIMENLDLEICLNKDPHMQEKYFMI